MAGTLCVVLALSGHETMDIPRGEPQFGIPGVPLPVGVEYYRAPTPKRDVWDEDLARIRAAGFRIIRSHS